MKTFMDVEQKNLAKYFEKKALPKKIYVVAPTRAIFIEWCTLRGIHPNNPGVTWINHHEKILGLMIFFQDEVAFVAREEFNPEELKRIELEINMRQRKE